MVEWTISAIDERLHVGDRVAYAGIAPERNRRPTINVGKIDAIDADNHRVRVVRELQSGNDIYDTEVRRVWVDTAKVVRARCS